MWQLENKNENKNNRNKERWQVLCERAATEHDPGRLTTIIRDLTTALAEKHRLEKVRRPKADQSSPSSQQPAK
jgi:hypothetical protein